MKIWILILLLSSNAGAESICSGLMSGDVNAHFTAYLSALFEARVLSAQDIATLAQGQNPFANDRSIEQKIHGAEIATYLAAPDFDLAAVIQWANEVEENHAQEQTERAGSEEQTRATVSQLKFKRVGPGRVFRIELTHPIEVMETLVTQQIYKEIMGENPSAELQDPEKPWIDPERPVNGMTWGKAAEFANKISERAGLAPVYDLAGGTINAPDGDIYRAAGYRLPTHAEALYFRSALYADDGQFRNGVRDETLDEYVWWDRNTRESQPVATLRPLFLDGNAFYDLVGNMSIWIHDAGDTDAASARSGVNPLLTDKDSPNLVYAFGARYLPTWSGLLFEFHKRHYLNESSRAIGIRLVRTLP